MDAADRTLLIIERDKLRKLDASRRDDDKEKRWAAVDEIEKEIDHEE
jgi:hypothetical protein